jgi:hypothetical protein
LVLAQIMSVPAEVTPVAPSGEQKAPGVTKAVDDVVEALVGSEVVDAAALDGGAVVDRAVAVVEGSVVVDEVAAGDVAEVEEAVDGGVVADGALVDRLVRGLAAATADVAEVEEEGADGVADVEIEVVMVGAAGRGATEARLMGGSES